ncbi:MAG: TonB-dependent receptor plug domain-containing protein [Caulobacteraceae bacterium]
MKVLYAGASAIVLTVVISGQALAQTAEAQKSPTGEVEAIVVTGTRTTGLKAVDSPAPVQVLGNDILKRVGQPDLVQSLSQNIPSLQAQSFGSDQAQFNKSFKLRGVSPNQTLVLVNGERRHGTGNVAVSGGAFGGNAAADLNYIPVGAIDHVEVLQDGAAAQYGTDAIAGVVNIILKKNTHGGSISMTGGHYMDQGGLTTDIQANIGFAPTDNSFLNVTVQNKFQGNSFRGAVDPRVVNLSGGTTGYNIPEFGRVLSPRNVSAALLTTQGGRYAQAQAFQNYPYSNWIQGDGQTQLSNVVYNAGLNLSELVNIYSFGTVGYKDGRAYENYRLPNVVTLDGKNTGIPVFPGGFSPMENIRETDYAFTVGAKGEYKGTTYNLASTYGRNYDRIYVLGSANADYQVDFGYTPTNFHDGDFTATEWTTNLDLTHGFEVGLPEPITLAGGFEYRINSYELKAGDPASYYSTGHSAGGGGAQSFFGYSPANAGYHQRSNWSVYGDIAATPIKQVKVDLAVRHEDYTDFGDTTIYKGTVRYDPLDIIGIRGTVDTGFRAPTMAEEFYSGINVGPTTISGVFAPNSAGASFLGISGLKPEKSFDYSVGLVTHFLPRLTMTLDGYSMKITDRIIQSGTFLGYTNTARPQNDVSPSVLQAITASGVVIPPGIFTATSSASVGVNVFVNGADTQTYGLDYVATYAMDYGAWGHVDYSLSLNYNDTKVLKVAKPPSNVSPNATILDSVAGVTGLENGTPKWRATLNAYWAKGPWSFNARENFYGSSYAYSQNGIDGKYYQQVTASAFLTDLEGSYEFPHRVKFSMGANNVFNKYPNKQVWANRLANLINNSSGFASQYNTGPYGYNGGFYYGRLTWTF